MSEMKQKSPARAGLFRRQAVLLLGADDLDVDTTVGLQAGDKRVDPDELTQVSDSGERAQPTHLQREKQRVKKGRPVGAALLLFST